MEFLNPRYLSEAFEVLDSRGGELKIAAGMTHLLRFYGRFPEELQSRYKGILHIGDITALSEGREEHKRYVMGATTKITYLERDAYLGRYAPSLLEAASATSTPQIRNRRTLGGEIAWGAYHSPLIVTLLSLDASVRVRFMGQNGNSGSEESFDLMDFYEGSLERVSSHGKKIINRKPKTESQNLLVKVMLSEELIHRPGHFCFFRALHPKISMENPGVVLAVSGHQHNGIIQEAQVVASGGWLWTLKTRLPLEGVRMSDIHIFEKLYAYCDRYSFEKFRREGPSAGQLGLILFGLLKEGFSALLGR